MSQTLVIMPYGIRSYISHQDRLTVDFDKIYQDIIRPGIIDAGHTSLRIDELSEAGDINHQYINKLFVAEIVVADISMPNGNVYYELGIRQSLSNRLTILVARMGTDLPFDLQSQRILFYDDGTDKLKIDSRTKLTNLLIRAQSAAYINPVHSYLRAFALVSDPTNAVAFEKDFRGRIDRASNEDQLTAVWNWAKPNSPLPPYVLLELAKKSAAVQQWKLAAEVAQAACDLRPDDYELQRSLGWFLRNLGSEHYTDAERALRKALELNPGDPEAIGMLGGLLKRQGNYADATGVYLQGLRIAPDNLYLRIAHAGTTLLSDPDRPWRALELYADLRGELLNVADSTNAWTLAVLGEAEFVLGDDANALRHFRRAYELSSSPTVLNSPADQIELFAKSGFRREQGLELATVLRNLTSLTGGVPSTRQPVNINRGISKWPAILHLSDSHFGSIAKPGGSFTPMHRFKDDDDSISLSKHLFNEFRRSKSRFKFDSEQIYVVISGDFVYTATQSEYQEALLFVEALAKDFNISKSRFIFCPGNHDVNWKDSEIDRKRRFDNYLSFLLGFYGETLFKSLYPLITWDFRVNTQRPDPTDILSVVKFDAHSILFASLNSCVYETEEQHYGYISRKQLNKLEDLLESIGDQVATKVCVLHHHIHPYPEQVRLDAIAGHWTDLSTLRDGGLVEEFLEKHGFDIVLHGHKHKPQLRETLVRHGPSAESWRPLFICGAGSCGVNASELEHSVSNQYQVLELLGERRAHGIDFLKIEWRSLPLSPSAEWSTSGEWTLLG